MNRKERKAQKYQNLLRCEWCNRWSEVSPKLWKFVYKEAPDHVYFCNRQRCIDLRPENIQDRVEDGEFYISLSKIPDDDDEYQALR